MSLMQGLKVAAFVRAADAQRYAASHFMYLKVKHMNRKTILMAGIIAVCCLFFTACPMGDGGASVEGRVSDENGKPIKGAKVVLVSRGTKGESESRDDGSYNVGVTHPPRAPTGTLTVSKEGYETYQQQFNSRDELGDKRDIVLKVVGSSK